MMKWAVRIVIVLVLLLIVAAVAVYFTVDALSRRAVEQGATYATGVPTTVERVSLGIFGGEASLAGLQIANPQGFEQPFFLHLGQGDVAVTLNSVMQDVVEVPRVHLKDIEVNLEKEGEQTNYGVILENLQRLSTREPQPDDQQWIVRDLWLSNIRVTAEVDGMLAREQQRVELTIPEIRLEDVRSDSLEELNGLILQQILGTVAQQAAAQLPGMIANELAGGVGRVGELGQATLERVSDVTGVVGGLSERLEGLGDEAGRRLEGAGEGVNRALEGVGGLLRRDRQPRDEAPEQPAE